MERNIDFGLTCDRLINRHLLSHTPGIEDFLIRYRLQVTPSLNHHTESKYKGCNSKNFGSINELTLVYRVDRKDRTQG